MLPRHFPIMDVARMFLRRRTSFEVKNRPPKLGEIQAHHDQTE
jgi:hypothetical protein